MKKITAISLVLVMLSACAALAGDKAGMPGGGKLILMTAGTQGTYYGFCGVLAGKVNAKTSTTITTI